MVERTFIKPVSATQIRSSFGYTILLEKRGRAGEVVVELSLASVLDLSWTRANELEKLLTKFLEDQPTIMLDDETVLKAKIAAARTRQCYLQKDFDAAKKDEEECKEALKKLKDT